MAKKKTVEIMMNNKNHIKIKKDKCQKCGHCCRNLIVEIEKLDVIREPRLLEGVLNSEPLDFNGEPRDIYGLKIPCPFLMKNNQCSIYPTRPNVCVGFNFGSSQCKYDRRESVSSKQEAKKNIGEDSVESDE